MPSHTLSVPYAPATTNPHGGLVHWRNVLVHAYGVDADLVNALADEWKAAGYPGDCFGRYAVERKIITDADYSASLAALEQTRRKEVVIDETDGGDTLLMMSDIDSSGGDALPETLLNIPTIDEILKTTEGVHLSGDPVTPSADKPCPPKPPSPILPLAVEKSLKERGVLPGQTRLFLRKQNPQPRRSENRPTLEKSVGSRSASERPVFSKPDGRTQRLTKKTSLLYSSKPDTAASPDSSSTTDSSSTPVSSSTPDSSSSRSRIGRSTVILPPDQQLPSSRHTGLPDIGTKLGELWLMRVLGEGGCSVVYQAAHVGLKIPVAVKLLKPVIESRPDYRSAFRREAVLTANLSHPNIVCVIDFFELDGRDVLALEYVDGLSMDKLLRAVGRIYPPKLVAVAAQLSRGLNEALEQGITHRDLKPSNFLLSGSLKVKISDFGLANLYNPLSKNTISRSQTGDHAISGTPTYIAPEQSIPGADCDHRADIYSFGVSLYQLASGRPPFIGDDAAELILQHREARPAPLSDLVPDMPPPFAKLIDSMLEKNPDSRPYDYKEILDALGRIAQNMLG